MQFPEKCVRGIPSTDCLLEGGSIASTSLFPFPSARCREDGWIEESVNWMDNDHVVDFTLNQTKENGEQRFRAGIAILPRRELDKLKKRIGITQYFNYERAAMEGNDYHGNLLLHQNVGHALKNLIRHALALASQIVLRKEKTGECASN